jgi:hypothetical protein
MPSRLEELLVLLPVLHDPVSLAAGVGGFKQLHGNFTPLQSFKLTCCRSFYLDVPGTQLLVGEHDSSNSRLRRISLLCPQSPSYISLPPGSGVVRCLAGQQQQQQQAIGSKYVAVATEKAGLLIANMDSNNIIQK